MRKLMVMGLLAVAMIPVWGQKSEVRRINSFTGIKAAKSVDVYLKKGEKHSVRVEVEGADLSDVITEISGDYLKIHMQSGNFRKANVKAYVTYVSLSKISASSASNIFSEGVIQSERLDISASSAANIELNINVGEMTIDVSSAADIVLEGKAKVIEVEASSAADVDTYRLDSEVVKARASSAGTIKVTATKELDARASSGGDVRYRGNPMRTNIDSGSGGSVKKSN